MHLIDERADEFGLKDVAQRNPVEEAEQRLKHGLDQRGVLRIFLHRGRKSVVCIKQQMAK